MKTRGVIACGHALTAQAAEQILREGGNAFDAIVAAHFAACAAEPVLTSLGGGGYLLARTADRREIVYDFFAQTPIQRRDRADTDFYPIHANFGTVSQEFHIGAGSIATPGTVRGMFAIHKDLCTMPMRELARPAIEAMSQGIRINPLQAYLMQVVKPILSCNRSGRDIYQSLDKPGELLQAGEMLHQSAQADTLEAIAYEGDRLFYEGEIAGLITAQCLAGGHLKREDLLAYEVIKRQPLCLDYRGVRFLTNPPPSSGGILIGLAMKLLEGLNIGKQSHASFEHLAILTEVMELTNKARIDHALQGNDSAATLGMLDDTFLQSYQAEIHQRAACLRGTTHMSVMDAAGNLASMTVSNGEGCGSVLPGTGIMLNNMLGEEDINPQGFHRWPSNQRMTSMMSPGILLYPDGRSVVLGSGGSNRIRTALLQVLSNLLDFDLPLEQAVQSPRLHYEAGVLNLEHGFNSRMLEKMCERYTEHQVWDELNLFFGGVHSVMNHGRHFTAVGDPRRGGVSLLV